MSEDEHPDDEPDDEPAPVPRDGAEASSSLRFALGSSVASNILSVIGIFAEGASGARLATYRVGAAAFALAAIGFLLGAFLRRVRPSRGSLLGIAGSLTAAALVLAVVLVVVRLDGDPCPDPVEVTALVPVDGAHGFAGAVAEFSERHADERTGCKLANVTAYSAPWPDVRNAFRLGWEPDPTLDRDDPLHGFDPRRDVGPAPDLWLAESPAQIEEAEAMLGHGVLDADTAVPIGTTPLVLGVPSAVFADDFGTSDQVVAGTLPELMNRLEDEHGLPVVRSEPGVSYTALTFLKYLDGAGERSNPGAVQIENQLARSIERSGLALPGTDTDLLCDIATVHGSEPAVAVLTTERALSRYNAGDPLGPRCPLRGQARSGLSPLYLQELGSLEYRAASLDWGRPTAAGHAAALEALTERLAGEGWAPEQIGIRGNGYRGEALDGEVDFALYFQPSAERLGAADHEALLAAYSDNRVPTNVLLAIDASLTMGTQIDGEGRSRFQLAAEGVRTALEYLGPDDGAGLWTFPAEGDAAHFEVLDLARGRTSADAAVLDESYPLVRGVDLHQTIVDGVAEVERFSDGDAVAAVVVLTDGDDRDPAEVTIEQVRARVDESGVALYVIAVGDASCRAGAFTAMTRSPRITCLEASEDQIRSTFDGLFRQLWG